MKIIIDDTGSINEWENGKTGNLLISERKYNEVIDKIASKVLTPRQYESFVTRDTARVFTLSKKKSDLLMTIIDAKDY